MKKITKLLVLLTLVMTLTGCIKMRTEIIVKSSTEMTMNMDYLFEDSYFSSTGTTQEQLIQQAEESFKYTAENIKITAKSDVIDGKKWTGMTITGSFSKKDIGTMLSEKSINGQKHVVVTLARDTLFNNQLGGMNPDDMTGPNGQSIEEMKAMGLEMVMTFVMPSAAQSNFGTVNGNTVTIDLLDLSASSIQSIEISSPLSNGFDITFILAGVGIVVLLGAVYMLMKKKKATETTVVENVPPVQDMPSSQEAVTEIQSSDEVNVENGETEQLSSVVEPQTQEVVEEANTTVTYCPNCGHKISVDDVFCQKCGFKLNK